MTKLGLIILLSVIILSSGLCQPALPNPVTFGWDRPTDSAGNIAYELQWGSGFAILNTNITNYTVSNFPLGITNEVSIRSLGIGGQVDEPTVINVFNVVINLEQNFGDGWKILTNMQVTVQIDKAHSMFRARIDTK